MDGSLGYVGSSNDRVVFSRAAVIGCVTNSGTSPFRAATTTRQTTRIYWLIVTVSEPLEQVPDEVTDAVTEVVPVFTNCANPGVEENVSSEVSPDVQVALLVTSLLLLSIAVN